MKFLILLAPLWAVSVKEFIQIAAAALTFA